MNILVVEDDDPIREVEVAYLKQAGYNIIEAVDGDEALTKFSTQVDLVVLDLNLPKLDGIAVCKKIREQSKVPIIMVTARIEEIDEIIGLETGADDYLKKPFSPAVLVARVKSHLRRIGNKKIQLNNILVDPERMEVYVGDTVLNFTTTQFNILYTLVSQPGKVFTRDELMDRAYDSTLPPDILDRTIDAHIKSIRKKIEKNTKKPKYLITVIGKGYKYVSN